MAIFGRIVVSYSGFFVSNICTRDSALAQHWRGVAPPKVLYDMQMDKGAGRTDDKQKCHTSCRMLLKIGYSDCRKNKLFGRKKEGKNLVECDYQDHDSACPPKN